MAAAAAAQVPLPADRPLVALALEGGGALGLAHIGVIKVLEELGVPVDIVVGTSMGAIVGGAYAMGYDAGRMETLVARADWAELFSDAPRSPSENYEESLDRSRFFASFGFDFRGLRLGSGLLSGNRVLSFLDGLAIGWPSPIDFDELPRRFRAVAADLLSGEKVVFESGSVSEALRASMSIPGLFAPYPHSGSYLVDGGLVDNLPIELARSLGAQLVLAVDLRGGRELKAQAVERNPLDVLRRTMDIFVEAHVNEQLPAADYVLPVDLRGYLEVDFAHSAEILAAGEAAARSHFAELAAFGERARGGGEARGGAELAAGKAAAGTAGESRAPELLIVEGGTAAQRLRARAAFEPLLGKELGPEELAGPVEALYRSGRLESLRLRREKREGAEVLALSLEERRPAGHSLRLGLSYEASYAGWISNRITLSPSLLFRGLLLPDTRLVLDLEMIDALSLSASLRQPLGKSLFAELGAAYLRDFDTLLGISSIGYQYQTIAIRTGLRLGFLPFPGAELSLGWRQEWIEEFQFAELEEGGGMEGSALLEARFALRRLDSPIFPMSGLCLRLDYLESAPWLGSARSFRTLSGSGQAFLSPDRPFSLALLWRAGSDFSAGSGEAAPASYRPDLADRRLFPGLLSTEDRLGSHVAGAGLELKYRLAGLLDLPAFFFVQGSAGLALPELQPLPEALTRLHWNAGLGAGLRLNAAFGISLRAGLGRDSGGDFSPFLAIDLGAIGY